MEYIKNKILKVLPVGRDTFTRSGAEERVFSIRNRDPTKFCDNYVSTTKYNIFTFIPKFLFEQFSKLSNCYFLIVVILQLIPGLSHTGKFSTLVPLVIILLISCVKELYEDFKRYLLDRKTNSTCCKVLNFHWNKVNWSSLTVGNIIKLSENEHCPADIILVSSSNENGSCYISTMSLDGETNLKLKEATPATSEFDTLEKYNNVDILVKCEAPNSNLYDFNGSIQIESSPVFPLSESNIVLRGSVVRSTEWIIGICVYTGHDTKLLQNSVAAPIKRSKYEKVTNSILLVLFFFQISLSIIAGIINDAFSHSLYLKHWYLGVKNDSGISILYNLGSMILLFHTMIPISFSVTMEFIKLFQAYIMQRDKRMQDLDNNLALSVKTSSIIEDLGQVNFIFTDKTGTLTKNIMTLRNYSVNGNIYNVDNSMSAEDATSNPHLMLFYRNICLCNAVNPQTSENIFSPNGGVSSVVYSSSSPDELAMVNYLKEINILMTKRSPTEITLNEFGKTEKWNILCTIAFTSERKRMTVIVESSSGEILLFCKGADSVIFERKAEAGQFCDDVTMEHIDNFAVEGYRTLCFAYRRLDRTEFEGWYDIFSNSSLKSLEEKEEISNTIEKDLIILGVTAVQDELQDNINETLDILTQAGITTWVLTGDRIDTSINIGFSTGILQKDKRVIILDEENEEMLHSRLIKLNEEHKQSLCSKAGKLIVPKTKLNFSVVMSGDCFDIATSEFCKKAFLNFVLNAVSVICCRASPIQKKTAVELIKKNVHDTVTLAIGDGGNDCSMIQTANVGVGIYGLEGIQAANASDFSICKFSHLSILLLYYGGSFYRRICRTTLYFFYKNFVMTIPEIFYIFNNFYSGTLLVYPVFISLYNLVFTGLPPFLMGLLDEPISSEAFVKVPTLYWTSQSNILLNVKKFIFLTLNAVLHAGLLYYVIYFSFYRGVGDEWGVPLSRIQFCYIFAPHIIALVTLKACLELTSWTWLTHIIMCCGLASYVCFFGVMCRSFFALRYFPELLDVDISLYSTPLFWASIPIPFIILIPDFCYYVIRNEFFTPSVVAVGMLEQRKGIDWSNEFSVSHVKQCLLQKNKGRSNIIYKYLGFAFSTYQN